MKQSGNEQEISLVGATLFLSWPKKKKKQVQSFLMRFLMVVLSAVHITHAAICLLGSKRVFFLL